MQNRYVGDIGDYVKLALLRALQPGRRLGIAWWLYPDESGNGDGRHIEYLKQPDKWRALDPTVFDALGRIVNENTRRVSALQEAGLLGDSVFCNRPMPIEATPALRRLERDTWFAALRMELSGCDLVFLDPDNGLEPADFSLGAIASGQSVSLAQLSALSCQGRTLLVYHHQTRRPGGHDQELIHWANRLRDAGFTTVNALRARPYSPRAYFLLDADATLRDRAKEFAARWSMWLSWHALDS